MTFSDQDFCQALAEYAERRGYCITKLALQRIDELLVQLQIEVEPKYKFNLTDPDPEDIIIYPKMS